MEDVLDLPRIRELSTHTSNPRKDKLRVLALDDNTYCVFWPAGPKVYDVDHAVRIPMRSAKAAGCSDESLLAIVRDRLLRVQAGPNPTSETGRALHAVENALNYLKLQAM